MSSTQSLMAPYDIGSAIESTDESEGRFGLGFIFDIRNI